MFVGRTKYLPHFFYVLRIVQIHVGVSEMQFESEMELRILGATLDFRNRVILQRIEAAKAAQAIWIRRYLPAGPVVFRFDAFILIFECGLLGLLN